MGCGKESVTELHSEKQAEEAVYENGSATPRASNKRDVCHNGNIINININAIPAHQSHGDAVDMDGDGFFDIDNPCSETDCDDTTYDPENSCCDEGYEIDFEGPLFVAPTDEPGFYNWYEALAACEAKSVADGCDWFLPNMEELSALYDQRVDIGGFNETDRYFYWSSTEVDEDFSAAWDFNTDSQANGSKLENFDRCRCVRR